METDGVWTNYTENDHEIFEIKEIEYQVALLPDHFLEEDIEITYPLVNQYHFLQNEYSGGLIKLSRDRRDILLPPGFTSTDLLTVKIFHGEDLIDATQAHYVQEGMIIEFDMPQNLENEEIYHLLLYKNTSVLYDYYFRTSQFNTFTAKFDAVFGNSVTIWLWQEEPYWTDFHLTCDQTEDEQADHYESIPGTLLDLEFITSGNTWYNNSIMPEVYSLITSGKYQLTNRSEEPYGIPPVHYFEIEEGSDIILTENQISENNAPRQPVISSYNGFICHSLTAMAADLSDLKFQISPQSEKTPEEQEIMETQIAIPSSGIYKFDVHYRIPGIGTVTTTRRIEANLTLK